MRSPSCTTKSKEHASAVGAAFVCICIALFVSPLCSQTIAVLAPDSTDASRNFVEILAPALSAAGAKVLDGSLSAAAFRSVQPEDAFNLTTEDSKKVAAAIGCDFFILVRSAALRRSAFGRPEYYEANAAVFAVSARTGRLAYFASPRFEAPRSNGASEMLNRSTDKLAAEILARLRSTAKSEFAEPSRPEMEEVPDAGSPVAQPFKAPVPYRRIKPEYTADAAYYDIKATVDIEVDLNAAGTITRVEIVRWAGYGLDESVQKAVNEMNWRPAYRNNKPLPIRFLLRYNFKKIPQE